MTTVVITSKPTRVTVSSRGVQGPPGTRGWSPIFGIVEDGDRRVFQIEDWVGGTGFKPPVGQYVGTDGLVDDVADAVDVRGGIGDTGDLGWSPELAVVPDGERRVLQVADWVGGTGTAPDTGQYVGPTGLVSDIAEATDTRGERGPMGVAAGYEFGVFVIRDDGVVDGEYPATRSVWTEMVLNRFYAESVGGDSVVSVIVNGSIVHGPLTVNEGSPVTDTVLLELEEGDQVSFGIVAYGATRVWAQVDGAGS